MGEIKKQVTVTSTISVDEDNNEQCGQNCKHVVESNAGRCYYCGLFGGMIVDESLISLEDLADDNWEADPWRRVEKCLAAETTLHLATEKSSCLPDVVEKEKLRRNAPKFNEVDQCTK